MRKTIILTALALLTFSLHSQEILSSQETVRPNEFKRKFLHIQGDLRINEINSSIMTSPNGYLEVFEGENKILKKFDANINTETGDASVKDYIFNEDHFV